MCNAIVKPQLEALVTDFWGITEILGMIEKTLDINNPICGYGLTLETLKQKITALNETIESL